MIHVSNISTRDFAFPVNCTNYEVSADVLSSTNGSQIVHPFLKTVFSLLMSLKFSLRRGIGILR